MCLFGHFVQCLLYSISLDTASIRRCTWVSHANVFTYHGILWIEICMKQLGYDSKSPVSIIVSSIVIHRVCFNHKMGTRVRSRNLCRQLRGEALLTKIIHGLWAHLDHTGQRAKALWGSSLPVEMVLRSEWPLSFFSLSLSGGREYCLLALFTVEWWWLLGDRWDHEELFTWNSEQLYHQGAQSFFDLLLSIMCCVSVDFVFFLFIVLKCVLCGFIFSHQWLWSVFEDSLVKL